MNQKVHVILKNGKEFVMECKKATVSYNTITGLMTKIEYEGCEKNIPLYLDVSKVVAVIQEYV